MNLGLKGKIVVVTGGSKGIGLACAAAFAEEGCEVVIVSRSHNNLDRASDLLAKRNIQVASCAADLTIASEAMKVISFVQSKVGSIDVLINSAGGAQQKPLNELSIADWHDAMDAKFFSYVHMMQAVLPDMARRKTGCVINVIGMGGKVGRPHAVTGGAANAALMLATTALSKGYAPYGVRVNALNPGLTLTERQLKRVEARVTKTGESMENINAEQVRSIPIGRLAAPEDIANAALFLASERASYITGVCIPMDGGKLAVV